MTKKIRRIVEIARMESSTISDTTLPIAVVKAFRNALIRVEVLVIRPKADGPHVLVFQAVIE